MAVVASGYVNTGQLLQLGSYTLLPGVQFLAVMTYTSGDIDLFAKYSAPPTTSSYDFFRNYGYRSEGLAIYPDGTWDKIYIAVNGWVGGDYTLSVEPLVSDGSLVASETLTQGEVGQIQFHLKQVGINFLPESFTTGYTLVELNLIRAALVRVEQAYNRTVLAYDLKLGSDQQFVDQSIQVETVRATSTTTTTYGDRTTTNYEYVPYNQRVSAYHREVEQLAIAVGVAYA